MIFALPETMTSQRENSTMALQIFLAGLEFSATGLSLDTVDSSVQSHHRQPVNPNSHAIDQVSPVLRTSSLQKDALSAE